MIINALNVVWSGIYILQIITHEELERLTIWDELDFEYKKLPVKIKDIHKIEKYNSISVSVFG